MTDLDLFCDELRAYLGLCPLPDRADYSRLRILEVLTTDMHLNDIAYQLARSPSQVCKDLNKLAQKGLVQRDTKRGYWRLKHG
jgi:predicted transcriptional regulator